MEIIGFNQNVYWNCKLKYQVYDNRKIPSMCLKCMYVESTDRFKQTTTKIPLSYFNSRVRDIVKVNLKA